MANHFFNDIPVETDLSIFENWESTASELQLENFTPSEVWARLASAENTARGLDRITYDHWRTIDPEAHTLSAIFSLCLKYEKIPGPWRKSCTVFLPKKENCLSMSDWRPISLCNTISKLFTGCLTKRIIDWISTNEVLSPAQRGFLPFHGAFENNYMFPYKFQETCRSPNQQLCLHQLI